MSRAITPDSLAGRLRAALRAQNQTAAEIARACGFSKQNMQRFLNGDVTRSKYLPVMAKRLNVSLEWLTVGDPAQAPTWWQPPERALPAGRQLNGAHTGFSELHSFEWNENWRVTPMRGDGGVPLAEDGADVITEPGRMPTMNSILLVRRQEGPLLKRFGGRIGDQVLWASVDLGKNPELVSDEVLSEAEVVVGILFKVSA